MPKLLGNELAEYEWVEGEVVAGLVLGWNFGDGHLHDERLLQIVQRACQFQPGELRCLFIESQPLFGSGLDVRLWDAAEGSMHRESVSVDELKERAPWQLG